MADFMTTLNSYFLHEISQWFMGLWYSMFQMAVHFNTKPPCIAVIHCTDAAYCKIFLSFSVFYMYAIASNTESVLQIAGGIFSLSFNADCNLPFVSG